VAEQDGVYLNYIISVHYIIIVTMVQCVSGLKTLTVVSGTGYLRTI